MFVADMRHTGSKCVVTAMLEAKCAIGKWGWLRAGKIVTAVWTCAPAFSAQGYATECNRRIAPRTPIPQWRSMASTRHLHGQAPGNWNRAILLQALGAEGLAMVALGTMEYANGNHPRQPAVKRHFGKQEAFILAQCAMREPVDGLTEGRRACIQEVLRREAVDVAWPDGSPSYQMGH